MSSGVRHGLGFLAALILTPAIRLGTMYGTQKVGLLTPEWSLSGRETLLGLGALAGVALLLALLTGSRLSPLASLVAGGGLTAVAAAWVVAPNTTSNLVVGALPPFLSRDTNLHAVAETMLGVFGLMLLLASLPPSRWRRRPAKATASSGYGTEPAAESTPDTPQPPSTYTTPPGHIGAFTPHQTPPPTPYAGPDGGTDARPVIPGMEGGHAGGPPAPPAGSGGGVGEWTRTYGSGDLPGRS